MTLYTFNNKQLAEISNTNFGIERILERDVQAALRDKIDVISPDTLVISEEFSEWNESARRIDLLGIDKRVNLVVIELKRDETGVHMELQALRYAAMVSTLTFKKAVDIYQKYLDKRNLEKNAEQEIKDFLGWSEPLEDQFPTDVRIVLASANFSKELTTTVMWLNERNLDIRCVRLQPYKLEEQILLDIEQIIPLPEAEDYQVKVREQSEERRAAARDSSRDTTQYSFMGNVHGKNRLVLSVVTQHIKKRPDMTFQELKEDFPDCLQGRGVVVLLENAEEIFTRTGHKRHFISEGEILITSDNKKIAVSTQWDARNINNFINRARELGYQIEAQ
jgi:hypothetical protein